MRVHVVALHDNWVLERYAKVLQKHLGWTVSPEPRLDVDCNHFFPYLLWKPLKTKTTAWFTHLEEDERRPDRPNSKVSRWHRAAQGVNIRFCQAMKYKRVLEPYGPTVQAPTPVDFKRFRLPKLRIGVAGRVYRIGRRKGEHLVKRLVGLDEFKIIGAGSGWPCPTKMYDWRDIPAFYQGLDVFLVSSLVEGGPQTAIEALACGVIVVGPEDVGFLDELPIVRYRKNDFDDMLAKLRGIGNLRKNRRRAVFERFAEAEWARVYKEAMQEYL